MRMAVGADDNIEGSGQLVDHATAGELYVCLLAEVVAHHDFEYRASETPALWLRYRWTGMLLT